MIELMLPVGIQALRAEDGFLRFQIEQGAGGNTDDQQIVERDGHGMANVEMGFPQL